MGILSCKEDISLLLNNYKQSSTLEKFEKIRRHCNDSSSLSESIIDDFLLYYAGDRYKLARQFDKQIARYRHATTDLQQSWTNMFKSQYVASKIFAEGGPINKIINHSALNHLDEREIEFLESQIENPWTFSFSYIIENPAPDFYDMEDLFTGENFLLYSPSVTTILQENPVRMWFTLNNFNGLCRQSYGPVLHFCGFEQEDIIFYATEINNGNWIEHSDQLMEIVHKNPIPFQLLIYGSMLPLSFHKEHQVVKNYAEYIDESFDASVFERHFKVEYADSIYRMSLRKWDEFPHYAQIYYDEKESTLFLISLTDLGFTKLTEALNEAGYEISEKPDFRVNMSMESTAKKILRRELKSFEYDQPFKNPDESEDEGLDNLNQVLAKIIPDINAGKKPDIEKLAKEAGIEIAEMKELIEHLLEKVHGKRG